MKLRRLILPAFVAGLVVLMAAGLPGNIATTQAATLTASVTLLGEAENPAVKGDASATARFVYNDVNRQLDWSVTVSGLSSDLVTAAHIHRGAIGVNGPIIYTLSATGFTQASGTLTLAEGDVSDLRAGNLYVNVHSKENPGGFARAQIFLDAPQGIQASIAGAIAAWNAGNVRAFLGYWTDAGILDAFGGTIDQVAPELAMEMQQTPIALRSLTDVQIRGSKVTGVLELIFGVSLDRTLDTFVLQNGVWKISNEEDLPVTIPSNIRAVNVGLQEFSFVYDRAQITPGQPVAFKATNTGKQDHEIILVALDTDKPLLQLLAEGDEDTIPEGISFLGGQEDIKPGQSRNLVILAPLAPGRYAFLCFLPDTDGAPHAFKGMVSEFNIGGAASGPAAGGGSASIRPPSTGDAGLVASHGNVLTLAGLTLLAFAGAGTMILAARKSS